MQDLISQTAAHLRAGRKGRMRIVCDLRMSESLLPQVVARFSRDHGGVEISLETQRLDDLPNMSRPASSTSALPWSRIRVLRWTICRWRSSTWSAPALPTARSRN